ncbi:hypothetical protein LguiB_003569 [Lonicera macranthoides]
MAAHTLSLLSIAPSACCRNSIDYSPLAPLGLKLDNLSTSFVGQKLSVRPSSPRQYVLKQRSSTVATISFSLPTAKPERTSGKSPKWSARAIKSFGMGRLEAIKMKFPKTETQFLLLGIMVEGTSLAAKFLRENDITMAKVREETINLLGKSYKYCEVEEQPPLTPQAQKALDWAVDEKLKSGETGEITTSHLLLGVWSQKDSAGHKILANLGFDDEKAKQIAKFMNADIILSFKKGLS